MFAQRADVICRQGLALINVAADVADVAFLLDGLGLGLDFGMVIGVGHAGFAGKRRHLGHFGQKYGVALQLPGIHHLGGDVGVGAGRQV